MAKENAFLAAEDIDGDGKFIVPEAVLKFMGADIGDTLLALRGPREGSVLMWKPNKEDDRSVPIEPDGSVVLPADARNALFGDEGGKIAILQGPRPKCVIIWEETYDEGYGKKSGF